MTEEHTMLYQSVNRIPRTCLVAVLFGLNALSCGGDSSENPAGGGGTAEALVAPADLKVMPVAGPALHVTWKDTASEHHFSIERKSGDGQFVEVGTEQINITAYHDANVTAGTAYTYRVAAAKASGEKGPYSSEVSATPMP